MTDIKPQALKSALPTVQASESLQAEVVPGKVEVPASHVTQTQIAEPTGIPAPIAQPQAPNTPKWVKLAQRLLPKADFSAFGAERLREMPAASARSAGANLMDQVLQLKNREHKGDADGLSIRALPETPRKSGLSKSAKAEKDYDPFNRPFTNYRLNMFENDPEDYALTFIFGTENAAPKAYQLLVGLSVHEALEKVFTWMKESRSGASITLQDVLAEYDAAWERNLKQGSYRAQDGWKPADFKQRGRDYISRRFAMMAPFDKTGRILGIEERVLWTMNDPATGKSYEFKGKLDRLMLEGDTIVIHDWKTHFNPPSLQQLKDGDYQLGLYALGLLRSRPDLVKGRKIKLAWDFKEFSQEFIVDEEYLKGVEAKVFDVLRRIETFTERVASEREEWQKRLSPEKNPSGLQAAAEAADRLGQIGSELAEKSAELRKLRREYDGLEEGLLRYAKAGKLERVDGKSHSADIETKEARGVPTKTSDAQAHAAAVEILKKAGVWEKYSSLDPASVRRMAEVLGGTDHEAFKRIKGELRSEMTHEVQISPVEEEYSGRGGGVKNPTVPRKAASSEDFVPGLLSPTQLSTFLADRERFARHYILGLRDLGPKPMGMLAGSAIHGAMEQIFTWLKGGRLMKDIQLPQLLKEFDAQWEEMRDNADYRTDKGLTAADYKRGSKAYLRAVWKRMAPFDQGRVVYLERRMYFTLTDPETGKTYRMQGIPDRVMLDGDTVVIRDWKTHMKPPSDEEIRKNDYQLGLYVLALRKLYPDLMRGRKARLIWDFKERSTVIEADDAYVENVQKRLFSILREMDAFREEVNADRTAWEERLAPADVPKNRAEAGRRVDTMADLAAKIERVQDASKALKEEYSKLEDQVVDFSRRTGRVLVEGDAYSAKLVKRGAYSVPTKTREREAHEKIVSILKGAGVWEKYSQLDYAALKKAMADPKNPDQGVFKLLKPYMRDAGSVKVKLSER
ncbi:MAG: PD-(D/E)XK nuclease family protein [Elusimicrobia bacterium]|nr:PD-(D/E)XK nuclease family protein [Elusimicrobiota bacterium]